MPEGGSMRDHWWWRPGWRTGRSFYTWHITFADQPEAASLVAEYAPVLDGLPMLDPVPLRWLHLTMQGVGFTDEVVRADLERIIAAAQKRCAAMQPFTVAIGPAHVDPETIQMPVRPVEPLVAVRQAIRDAIGDVWGTDNVPETADGWRPHVSLGYSNAGGPAGPIVAALANHNERIANVTVAAVSLINLNRDRQLYEWSDVGSAPLGH